MLNWIWLGMVLAAVLIAGSTGKMEAIATGAVKGAETAVTLALGLIGIMTVWMGIMRLAERSGFVHLIARVLRPVLRWLFPDVPHDHPAMGSMVMNIAANMLGLINAATPLGLRAMRDLEKLNPNPGTATNAMCTFLAINTGSVQLIPITAIGVLAAAGSVAPYSIVGTALIATCFSSAAGLIAVKLFEKMRAFRAVPIENTPRPEVKEIVTPAEEQITPEKAPLKPWQLLVMVAFTGFFGWAIYEMAFGRFLQDANRSEMIRLVDAISKAAIPFLLVFFPLYAALKGVKVYEELVEGGKEGFNVAIRIIPYLVIILLAIFMLRESGGIALFTDAVRPLMTAIGFPADLLPLSLMRPLSGSGSLGIFTEMVKEFGPDSMIVRMAGTLYGSTETTFYVIAVYFGAVGIKRTRHAIPAGLIADLAGTIAAVIVCRMMFG
jgi:spore maturation protein SpmA